MRIGIQFWPRYPVATMLNNARTALQTYPYDTIYSADEYQYTDSFTVLGLLASQLGTSVGSYVTFPSRNPLHIAQKISSITELLPKGKEAVLGFGSGGGVQKQVLRGHPDPVSITEESVRLIRRLLRGEIVELADFPSLVRRFAFNPEGKAKLYFPPKEPVPVCVAAGGKRNIEIAGRHGDGLILTQIIPISTLAAMKSGMFQDAMKAFEAARAASVNPSRPFRKLFGVHVSVSKDRAAARRWARQNISFILATDPKELRQLGFPLDDIPVMQRSYVKAEGVEAKGVVEAAAEKLRNHVLDYALDSAGFLCAGTVDECIERLSELSPYVKEAGFDEIIIADPLGPDVPEALALIGKEIAPAVAKMFT